MPILILALLALGVFLVMGLMLFYATYKEAHTRRPHPESQVKPAAR